jgi:hypothetical protein
MSAPQDPRAHDGAPDHSRSGADLAEAIEVAEVGSSVREVHDRPGATKSGEAPVEQVRDDPEMTEGQVVLGSGGSSPPDADAGGVSSGAAQSVRGARPVDRAASDS